MVTCTVATIMSGALTANVIVCLGWGLRFGKTRIQKMSSGNHEEWLYRSDKVRVRTCSDVSATYGSLTTESFVSGISDMDRPKGPKEDRVPKEFEGIRSWVEYSKSKTWLLEASRLSDQSNTLSALPREHQVAVPLPKSEVEKWLIRPTADALAGQLQAKLFVSSENTPWLMSHDDADAVTAQFSAILSSPNSQWLCKRSTRPDDLAKWLVEPKKPRLAPTSSFDPLSTWKTFQEGISWIAHPFSKDNDADTTPMDYESGEEEDLLGFPSSAPSSLPLPLSSPQQMGVDIDKWLLPSAVPSFSSLPLFEPTNPVGGVGTLNQWLSRSQSPSEHESEASLLTLSSEYELVNEL